MSLDGKKISELARVTSVRDDSLLVVDNGGTEANSVYVEDLLKKAGAAKQDKLTAGDNIKIENNVISATAITDRNIGEIVPSVLPLVDAGLHLLDGSLIDGNGIYGEFVDYIAGLYNDNPNASYFAKTTTIYNYEKVGLINETDGVVSNLSYGNYAITPAMLNLGTANSWEIVTKHYITSVGSVNDGMMGILGGAYNVNYYINASNKITVELSSNGSSYNIGSISMINAITLNTFFYVKLEFTGTAYNLYYSTDGTTYTLQGSITTSTKVGSRTNYFAFGVDEAGNHSAWTGKVDMNGCYININGERWWTGYTTFNPEESWQYYLTKYGSCGQFVYNSITNTVRLPRIEGIIEGTYTLAELSNLVEAGLPEIWGDTITDSVSNWHDSSTSPSGAFASNGGYTSLNGGNAYTMNVYSGDFRASRCSSVYGNSDTVQPQTIKVLYYIVIASSSKNTIGNDGTKYVADLKVKAENDFSNVAKPNQAFINQSINWMIPDYSRGINMSSPFTAPAPGVAMYSTAGNVETRINGNLVPVGGNDVSNEGPVTIVLGKGDVLTYTSDGGRGEVFYPFKGAI